MSGCSFLAFAVLSIPILLEVSSVWEMSLHDSLTHISSKAASLPSLLSHLFLSLPAFSQERKELVTKLAD